MSRPSRDFTLSTSPLSALIVPRTRTLVCAAAVAQARASSRKASGFMESPCGSRVNTFILRRIPC